MHFLFHFLQLPFLFVLSLPSRGTLFVFTLPYRGTLFVLSLPCFLHNFKMTALVMTEQEPPLHSQQVLSKKRLSAFVSL